MIQFIKYLIRIVIAIILFLAISILAMGYAFEGRSIYIFMIIIFLYSIYTIFFRTKYQVINIFIYIIGIFYISKRLYEIYLEKTFFNEALLDSFMVVISFLILISISIKKINKGVR